MTKCFSTFTLIWWPIKSKPSFRQYCAESFCAYGCQFTLNSKIALHGFALLWVWSVKETEDPRRLQKNVRMIECHSCHHLFHSLFQRQKNQYLVKTVRNVFTIFRDAYNMSCCLTEDIPLMSFQKCCFGWMDINFLKLEMALILVCSIFFIFSPKKNFHCTSSTYFFSFLSFLSMPFFTPRMFTPSRRRTAAVYCM